jgi:hypothetical protein
MAYGDAWEREVLTRLHEWERMRWEREVAERWMEPDDRLDDIGWDIFYCATRGMNETDAAQLALDGNLRQRLRVRDDLLRRHHLDLERRYAELHPAGAQFGVFDTTAPDQIEFWRSQLAQPTFIYFIQSGEDGPIKIGYSGRPDRRLPQLQTGNPRELILRHVIPGDTSVERQLHTRFEPARIRGEWFGREYLPVIITFAGGLADRMLQSYDGSGVPPRLIGGEVRTNSELARIRADIERLWLAGHETPAIARYTWLDQEEVETQLEEMRGLEIYDVHRKGGFDFRGGRLVAYRSRWPKRVRRSARAGRIGPAPAGEPLHPEADPPTPDGP